MAKNPSWWIKLPALGILGFSLLVCFYAGMGVIDANREAPAHVIGPLVGPVADAARSLLPLLPGLFGVLGVAVVYLLLVTGASVAAQRGWFRGQSMMTRLGNSTVPITGVETGGEDGAVTPSVSDAGVGSEAASVSKNEPWSTVPGSTGEFLKAAARFVYADPYQSAAYRRLHPLLMDPRSGSERDVPPTLRRKKGA